MSHTPEEAKRAVGRILTKANPENEVAYAVIFRAVKVCIAAGMSRRQSAKYLGVPARRIDRHGQYFRTARSVRTLFSEAFASTSNPIQEDNAKRKLIEWAWKP